MRQLLMFVALGMLLGACGGASDYYEETGEPKWVVRGSGAFNEEGKRIFYGVGQVNGIANRALARTSAENRARAELARIFKVYVAALYKDYMASTTGGDMTASAEEQHVEQAVKTFTDATLSGVMIVDHWIDPSDGTHFALAKLDLEAFGNALDKVKELDAKTREFVRKNAARAFDELRIEEERHR